MRRTPAGEGHDGGDRAGRRAGFARAVREQRGLLRERPRQCLRADNGGAYSSREADALIDAASATLDPEARLMLLRRLGERVRADLPVIPLLRREDLYGAGAAVSFELRLDREIRGDTIVVDRK